MQDGTATYVGTVGGTADVITITPTIAITAYAAGQRFSFLASGTNTGATTLNVSAVGAKAVVRNDGVMNSRVVEVIGIELRLGAGRRATGR